MSMLDNKVELIDYHILILLILRSRNIENFLAKSITEYIVPYRLPIDNVAKILYYGYSSEIYSLHRFLAKNNLKYSIFPYINPLLYNMSSISTVFISYHKYYDNTNNKIYYNIEYNINLFYIYYIEYFQFNLDNENLYLYLNDLTFIEFDTINMMIWNDNSGILMDNYVFSSSIKKYIYYQIYKKCIRPFFTLLHI